ncbi:L-threonylcarbamoyladenylate synthase [Jejuia pallidilutea]|uniref:Threonylcarbamoyl-AMP synthase n=1 Tax=Jejuia pallidilutea TaxID=504487 RepID=A0A090W4W3_9FLAO|nr:L-threonylcarbamoyladenylate synthase [Jejuia pallidilutea]GAL67659.1 TsaC protein [Jejuia pallidilutea]GAL72045.1 TsaC protein [Jejuia pallidilutea]GAL88381.1 TsaC protein [Jejuia pallidilutea]
MGIISKDIKKAVALLQNEELVAIPTETVYGLAGNIYSEKAIKAIFNTKQRPFFNPLIVHIQSPEYLATIVSHIPKKAQQLANAFWPGPLTLVLPKKDTIPDVITAGKNTVAVRVPNHPVTLELLKQLPFPLAAPSANPFNRISPTTALHVENYFRNTIQMVLEGGACKNGIESTIIGFENNDPIIYRLGSISVEDIKAVIGEIAIKNKKEINPDAPGMLEKHYAPSTLTVLSSNIVKDLEKYRNKRIGVLSFKNRIDNIAIKHQIVLSETGDMAEATSKLYNALHQLDTLHLDIIIAEIFPDYGLGTSVNDRLQRAAHTI